jgi:hypothetical protein
MGDEFALLDLADRRGASVFPRLVSLKNASDGGDAGWRWWTGARFGPLTRGTPKGDIAHSRAARR